MFAPEHATPLAAAQTLAQKQADLFKKLQVGEGGAAEVNRPDLATQVPVAQTMANAKKLGLTMEQLKAQNIGDPEHTMRVAALAQTVHGDAGELRDMALDILKRQDAGEDVTADSQTWWNRVSALAPQAGRLAGERSAAGRTLQILDPLKNPETAMASAVNRFALQAGDGQTMGDMMQMFARTTDPEVLAQQLGKMNESVQAGGSLKGAISDYYYGALLSRPRTLVKKAAGDLWSMALSIPTRQMASMTSSDVAPTEAPAMVNAWMHNVGDALRIAGKTWKSGSSEFDRLYPGEEAAFERPLTQITSTGTRFENTLTGQGIDLLGHVIGLGPRSMGGLQDFARTMNMRAQVAALAERQGWKEAMDQGLSGGEAGNFIKQRVADLTNDTPPEMLANARNFATNQTYQSPLGPIMQGIKNGLDQIPLGIGRFMFPFVKTPMNLWKFARDNSPLGLASKQIWQDMQSGGADGAIARAKLGLGTLMSVKMGQWAMDGHITGGGPSDPKLLSDLKATGWKPYSFHIGDSYIPYGWAEPISMPLGIAADMHDTYAQATPGDREQQIEHIGGAFTIAMARNLSRQSYVQMFVNLSSLFDDYKEGKDPLEGVMKFGGRELKGLIPAALQGEAKREDPIMRQTRGMMDEFKAGTPGYSQELPPVRDLYGEKIPVPGGFMANEVYPFAVGHDAKDPVAQAIYDNGASPMRVPQLLPGSGRAPKYGDQPNNPDVGVPLTPQEQDRWSVLRASIKDPSTGMNMREALNALVADPQFKSAPSDEKAKALDHVVTGFSHGATGSLYAESADIRQRYAARMKYREMAHQPAPSGGITPASATAPSL
jgi:hypothetical protein